jgi:hypothetical protein
MCHMAHGATGRSRCRRENAGAVLRERTGIASAISVFMRFSSTLSIAFVLVACSASQSTTGRETSRVSSPPLIHRATAAACPTDRPPSGSIYNAPDASPDASYEKCNSDTQCTAGVNGRCFGNGHDGWACSYDTCSLDADCARGELCSCRSPWHYGDVGPNHCLPSNCLVDADCGPAGYCSPSLDAQCGSFVGVTGWYCHQPGDACTNDHDCSAVDGGQGQTFCGYQPEVGKWACITAGCVG